MILRRDSPVVILVVVSKLSLVYIGASTPSTLSLFFPIETFVLKTHTCWFYHCEYFLKVYIQAYPIQAFSITSFISSSHTITTNTRNASVHLEQYSTLPPNHKTTSGMLLLCSHWPHPILFFTAFILSMVGVQPIRASRGVFDKASTASRLSNIYSRPCMLAVR